MIGGTQFVGRYLVESALAAGHEVTLFHRGHTNPDLFPDVQRIVGDRAVERDLDALAGRRWDAVVDTCGFVTKVVRASAARLAGSVEHYTFVSSMSVYSDFQAVGQDETAPVARLPGDVEDELDLETYGARKALCEQAVEELFPGRALHVRPGLVVGPHDYVERFPYWVERVARGGEVLAPGRFDRPVQLIDVRDLAEWMLRQVEARATGVYNTTGPDHPLTMAEFLTACREATASEARFTWVPDDFLVEQKVSAFSELPFWIPEAESGALYTFDCSKAFAAGLRFRPLVDTARDVWEWLRSSPPFKRPDFIRLLKLPPTGMRPEREAEMLHAWHERRGNGGR